jgi:hypothetical protein
MPELPRATVTRPPPVAESDLSAAPSPNPRSGLSPPNAAPYTAPTGADGAKYAATAKPSESGNRCEPDAQPRPYIPPEPARRTPTAGRPKRARKPPLPGQGVLAPAERPTSAGNQGGTADSQLEPVPDTRGTGVLSPTRDREHPVPPTSSLQHPTSRSSIVHRPSSTVSQGRPPCP